MLAYTIPAEHLLEQQPDDLVGPLLKHLKSIEDSEGRLNRGNFGNDAYTAYGRNEAARRAVLEIWAVLEREGFIATHEHDWCFITRRGKDALLADSFDSFRLASLLPKDILHPMLLPNVWGAFVRGQYDTAVFEACKEVEIAVRSAGRFADSVLGVPLMRKAFDPDGGPLTDKTRLPAEQHALSDLFAGAIGSYKNPNSHRRVAITAKESVEMIVLASHLLAIVDSRADDENE